MKFRLKEEIEQSDFDSLIPLLNNKIDTVISCDDTLTITSDGIISLPITDYESIKNSYCYQKPLFPSAITFKCKLKNALINLQTLTINSDSLKDSKIKKLILKNSTNITIGSFSNAYYLEYVEFSLYDYSVPAFCFYNCYNLKKIIINGNYINLKRIDPYAFGNCRSLKYFSLPSTITAIKDYAFSGCDSLKELVIPKSISSLEPFSLANLPKNIKIIIEKPANEILKFKNYPFGLKENSIISCLDNTDIYIS